MESWHFPIERSLFHIKKRKKATVETVTIDAVEFIRNFLAPVLPKGLMRIRHYGVLANRCKNDNLIKRRYKPL